MTEGPRHTSLEDRWFAAVPPAKVSRLTRLKWRLVWKLLSFRPAQRYLERRYPS